MTGDEASTPPPNEPISDSPSADAVKGDQPEAKPANVRQYFLLGVMLLLAGALAYDFFVARPAAEAAYESIKEATNARLDSPDPQFTAVEIREHLKRSPAKTIVGPRYDIDVFQWRAGLPWRTYYCKVVYTKANNELRYCSMFLNEEADAEYLPDWQPEQPGVASSSDGVPAPPEDEEPPEGVGDPAKSKRPKRPERPTGQDSDSPGEQKGDADR